MQRKTLGSSAVPVFGFNAVAAVAVSWAIEGPFFALLCSAVILPTTLAVVKYTLQEPRERWSERPGWNGVTLD